MTSAAHLQVVRPIAAECEFERPVLVHEAVQRAAAGTAVEPQHDRIAGRAALRCRKIVPEVPAVVLINCNPSQRGLQFDAVRQKSDGLHMSMDV